MRSYFQSSLAATRVLRGGVVFAVTMCLIGELQAQVLEEVVVTARKRAESLQETPLSVVAFSAESLENQNIDDISDLNEKIPNVFIGAGGGAGTNSGAFSIRGIGQGRNAVNQESSVALYIDDAYFGRLAGALIQLVDVERIEVLRGPQGTLFGRNAIGGAIRYITKKPDDEFSGKVQVNLGEYSRRDIKGSLNVPLGENAAMRLAAGSINQDGFQINGLGQDLGDTHVDAVRATVRWQASDRLELLASADYSRSDQNGSPNSVLSICRTGDAGTKCPGGGPPNAIIQAEGAGFVFDPALLGSITRSGSILDAFFKQDNIGGSLTADYEINDNLSLKAVATVRSLDTDTAMDLDGTVAPLIQNDDVDRESDMWSAEIQLGGDALDDRLAWVAGFYYYEEESSDRRVARQGWDSPAPGGAFDNPGGTTIRVNDPHELTSTAVFSQGTYNVTDRFAVTLGGRYTWDDKNIRVEEYDSFEVPRTFPASDSQGRGGQPFFVSQEADWSDWSARLSFEYQATDNVFTFISFARGFEAGSLNDRAQASLPEELNYGVSIVDPSILETYEIGIRSDLLDDRLRLNLTYFDNDFSNVKVATAINLPSGTVILNGNGGAATSSGFELEAVFQPTDYLRFDLAAGFIDSEFTEGGPNIEIGAPQTRSPDHSFSAGAQFDTEAFGGDVSLRLDYSKVDDYVTNSTIDGSFAVGPYELLSMNLKYQAASERWALSVYGKNMTDNEYFVGALDFSPPPPFGFVQAIPARPSEYGVKMEFFF